MAKKILILLVAMVVCIASYTAYALDITEDEEFEEEKVDTSLMLDSPLFTQQEVDAEYKQNMTIDEETYKLALENSKFQLWHRPGRGYPIRVVNKETGFVWSSDGFGKASDSVFVMKALNEQKDFHPDILSSDKEYVSIKAKIEKSSSQVVYSVTTPLDGISFDYIIKLTDDGINLSLDNSSIVEEGSSQLASLTFFPYLGASGVVNNEVMAPGYIVIPSGNGGLIRYTSNPTINNLYTTAFYGTDLNYYQNNSRVGNVLSMPVFGMVHGVNDNACLVEVKDGVSIATFTYESAGVGANNYHKSYLTFNYRQKYTVATSAGKNIPMISDKTNCNMSVDYSFLGNEEANYVGIARKYQESLIEDGVLGDATLSESTRMHVEAFGREYEEGLIGKKYVNMTTINDLVDINEELSINGIHDILYTLKGYYKGGYSGAKPTNVNFEGSLGSLHKLDNNSMEYYLYYNPVETRNTKLKFPGYNLVNVYRTEYYLEEEKDAKYTFFTDVRTINEGIEKVNNKYGNNVAYDGITQYLYGDFNNNYTRQDTLDLYSRVLGDAKYPMYVPNAYLLKNTDKYLNMSLYHENMKFITDSVPFTQIVLRGYVDLYSTYLNFSSNQDLDVLKCIEYGVYPAYLITDKASHHLSDTLSNNLYATEYVRVRDKMISQYTKIKTALDPVAGAQIVGREVLALGVVEVTYSNGVAIVVDYNTMEYEVINNG